MQFKILSVEELVEITSGAFSFDRYKSWESCIRALKRHEFNDFEIQAILLSKWTRWAADSSEYPYGKVTAKDLMKFVSKQSEEDLFNLTCETFPDKYSKEVKDFYDDVKQKEKQTKELNKKIKTASISVKKHKI